MKPRLIPNQVNKRDKLPSKGFSKNTVRANRARNRAKMPTNWWIDNIATVKMTGAVYEANPGLWFCKNLSQSIRLTINRPRAKVSFLPGGVRRKILCWVARKERLHIRASLICPGTKERIRSKGAKTTIRVNITGIK